MQLDQIEAGLRECFSAQPAKHTDVELYEEATLGLIIAGVVLLVAVLAFTQLLPAGDQARAWTTFFTDHGGWHTLALVVFLATGFYLFHRTRKSKNLSYRAGTFCNALAFFLILLYFGGIVMATGAVQSSVFSSGFLSLFGIALVVPRSEALKLVLGIEAAAVQIVVLVLTRDQMPHSIVVWVFTIGAYGYALGFRYFQVLHGSRP